MNIRCVLAGLVIAGVFVAFVGSAADNKNDEKRTFDKAEQLEKAAQNREWAASIQKEQADTLLANAQDFRKKEYADEAQRSRNFIKAGDMERMAADLLGLSVLNLDRMAANWQLAADEYGKLKEEERQRNAKSRVELAKKEALSACLKVAEAYELAAEAFGPESGDDANRAATTVEKAAFWRENLAGRK